MSCVCCRVGNRVYRLRDVGYLDGVYECNAGSNTLVADDLQTFLANLLLAVSAFARDGSITDL